MTEQEIVKKIRDHYSDMWKEVFGPEAKDQEDHFPQTLSECLAQVDQITTIKEAADYIDGSTAQDHIKLKLKESLFNEALFLLSSKREGDDIYKTDPSN